MKPSSAVEIKTSMEIKPLMGIKHLYGKPTVNGN